MEVIAWQPWSSKAGHKARWQSFLLGQLPRDCKSSWPEEDQCGVRQGSEWKNSVPRPSCPVSFQTPDFKFPPGLTYVVGDVHNWNDCSLGLSRDHVRKVPLVNLHVHFESLTEGWYFHIISVSASASHFLQMALEDSVDFLGCRAGIIKWGGERSSILPFRVSSYSTPRVDFNKLLVVVCILTHVPDHAGSKLTMLRLVPEHLIRECIEKTIAYDWVNELAGQEGRVNMGKWYHFHRCPWRIARQHAARGTRW